MNSPQIVGESECEWFFLLQQIKSVCGSLGHCVCQFWIKKRIRVLGCPTCKEQFTPEEILCHCCHQHRPVQRCKLLELVHFPWLLCSMDHERSEECSGLLSAKPWSGDIEHGCQPQLHWGHLCQHKCGLMWLVHSHEENCKTFFSLNVKAHRGMRHARRASTSETDQTFLHRVQSPSAPKSGWDLSFPGVGQIM